MEDKGCFEKMLKDVKEKLDSLPEDSYVKTSLTNDILNGIESKIHKLPMNELKYVSYPPLFLFVYRYSFDAIKALEEDILLIENNSTSKSFKNLIGFLKASEREPRVWSSGLFEVFIKAVILKKFAKGSVRLDKKLPNGRNLDVSVQLSNRWINFEVTILSSSDEDYNVYNSFIEKELKKALIPYSLDQANMILLTQKDLVHTMMSSEYIEKFMIKLLMRN